MKKTTDELMNILKKKNSYKEYKETEAEYISYTLHEYLNYLILEKNLQKSDIIKRSGLDRTYSYQILSGVRLPSRDKLLALAFGMELNLEEVQTLLKTSHLSPLYVKNHRDSIIIFCLNKNVPLLETNELLYEMKESLIE
jgi:transcriptional regulator with XRE-family HTH domain